MKTIDLNYKKQGTGEPIIILHGLFGQLDNWQSIAKVLADEFEVVSVDLRNHGKSPHSQDFSYPVMAADVKKLVENLGLEKIILIGHSLGGKVALQFLNDYPELLNKVFVLDITPRAYKGGHEDIFKAMFSLNLTEISKRLEAEEKLKVFIPDMIVRQFILKNLDRNEENTFNWKFNLDVLYKNYHEINKKITITNSSIRNFEHLVFIKGSMSNYINKQDIIDIHNLFYKVEIIEVAGAGHWVHADKPEEVIKIIRESRREYLY